MMAVELVPRDEVLQLVEREQQDLASLEQRVIGAQSSAADLERELAELGAPPACEELIRRFHDHLRALRADAEREVAETLASARATRLPMTFDALAMSAATADATGDTHSPLPVATMSEIDLELAFWKDAPAEDAGRFSKLARPKVALPKVALPKVAVPKVARPMLRRAARSTNRTVRALEGGAAVLAVAALVLRLG